MSLTVTAKQQAQLERGFKSWSENSALRVRAKLGLKPIAPLAPEGLAHYLSVRVWSLVDVPGLSREAYDHLASVEGDEWSALTVRVGRQDVVVLNPSHSPARRASDLTHELAHILRQHEPTRVVVAHEIGVGLRTFNELQEAEANWLAGCLLLPRPALAHHTSRGSSHEVICQNFGVSSDLLRYRLNVTGVGRQYSV